MAAGREKRCNAGARIAALLEAEDEDDFYKTTYGGFNEEQDDNAYETEESDSDNVDSDFSIEEDDERRSDVDDDDLPKRKKRGVDTRAYKEPVRKAPKKEDNRSEPKERVQAKPGAHRSLIEIELSSIDKKSLRRSTAQKSVATELRIKEEAARNQMLKEIAAKKNVSEVRRLTQEELLAEAKITEELNLRSLETYQRLESEKRKARSQKQAYRGPIIRYQSVTMPLIEELPDGQISVEEDSESSRSTIETGTVSTDKCSRTFITFTDEKTFKSHFPLKKLKPPVKHYCPITRQQAKYFDPITQSPYATAQAFKVLRDTYLQQEQQTEKRLAEQEHRRKQRLATPTPPLQATVVT